MAREGLISQWRLPGECLQGDGTGDITQQLKGYMERLREKVQEHPYKSILRTHHYFLSILVAPVDTEDIDIGPDLSDVIDTICYKEVLVLSVPF